MPTLTEQFQALSEATADRDLKYQKKAEHFARVFVELVGNKVLEDLRKRGIGKEWARGEAWLIDARRIVPSLKGLDILLVVPGTPYARKMGLKRMAGGMLNIDAKGSGTMVLPWLTRKFDLPKVEYLEPKHRDVLVHELIHFYDSARWKGDVHKQADAKPGSAKYYRDPMELNAYYQAWAREIHDHVRSMLKGDYNRDGWDMMEWLDFQEWKKDMVNLREAPTKFLKSLNTAAKRRIDKRLYGLWMEMKRMYGADK